MSKFSKEQKGIMAGVLLSLILGIIAVVIGVKLSITALAIFGVLMIAFFCMMAPGIIFKIIEK